MARSYSSPRRQGDAERTRAAILDAAAALFARDGYAGTTMKSLACEAGVSVQSVHLAGPKASLLIAAYERAFAGDEGNHSLSERPALVEIMSDPDSLRAVSAWLDYVSDANARSGRLMRAMTAAAETDAAAAEALADLNARRRSDLRIAADWIVGRELSKREDQAHLADELDHLVGPESYAFFVLHCRWSGRHYRQWLDRGLHAILNPRHP